MCPQIKVNQVKGLSLRNTRIQLHSVEKVKCTTDATSGLAPKFT